MDESTWLKDLKSLSMRSAGIPMPVSRTENLSAARFPSPTAGSSPLDATGATVSRISPCLVNFTALLSRLTST